MAQEHPSPFGNRHSAIANPSNLLPYTGPALTPWQYEALCHHVLSREYGTQHSAFSLRNGPVPAPGRLAPVRPASIPNKMILSPAKPPRAPGPFGIRRK
jgi:hypothetical protein